jgi:hypothetical protein
MILYRVCKWLNPCNGCLSSPGLSSQPDGYKAVMAIDTQNSTDGITVLDATDAFAAKGYVTQFAAVEGAMVRCFGCHVDTDATEFKIDALERSEGASDPSDMVANVAAQCPACDALGVLTLKYGPDSSYEEQEVLSVIDDNRNRWSGGTSV